MRDYLRHNIWEYLLCTLITTALALNVFAGFYIPAETAQNVLATLALAAGLQLICYVTAYNKFTLLVLIPLLAAACAVFFFSLRARGIDIVDSPDSPTVMYIYYLLLAGIGLLVFVLTRWCVGTVVLFILGVLVLGGLAFLDFSVLWYGLLCFVLCCPVLYILRLYRHSALASSTVRPDFFSCCRAGLLTAGVALVLSGAFYLGVVRPLSPPTLDLQLIVKYMSFEILDKVGISQQYAALDPDLFSSQHDDTTITSPEIGEELGEQAANQNEELTAPDDPQGDAALEIGSGPLLEALRRQAVSYKFNRLLAVWLACALIALFAMVLLLRWLLRRRRQHRLLQGSKEEQVARMYRWYLQQWKRLGFPRRPEETPTEYAHRCESRLRAFATSGLDVSGLTALLVRTVYGGQPVAEIDYQNCFDFYQAFPANCRRMTGRWKYLRKFFWL